MAMGSRVLSGAMSFVFGLVMGTACEEVRTDERARTQPDSEGEYVDAGRADESAAPTEGGVQDCVQQRSLIRAAIESSRASPNTVVAVRNEACGLMVVADGDPTSATEDSLFLYASVTKTFVATAVLSLVAEGKLGLDEQIGKWFGNLEPRYSPVTVRMLLNHTSGIYDSSLPGSGPWDYEALVTESLRHEPYGPPGSGYHYSGVNFLILGLIIQKTEGASVGSVLRERVIDPAGLEHVFFWPEEEPQGVFAIQYDQAGGVVEQAAPGFYWTAGGMVGTMGDLADYLWTNYESKSLLTPTIFEEMVRNPVECMASGKELHRSSGLGVNLVEFAGSSCGTALGHNGLVYGTTVDAFHFPDCKVSISVGQNTIVGLPQREAVLVSVLQALFP